MAKRDCSWSKKVLRLIIRHCVSRKARLKIDKAVRSHPDWHQFKAEFWEITPAFPSVIFETTTKRLTVRIKECWVPLGPSRTRCHIDDLLEKLGQEGEILYGNVNLPMTVVVFPYYEKEQGLVCLPEEAQALIRRNPLRDAVTIEP